MCVCVCVCVRVCVQVRVCADIRKHCVCMYAQLYNTLCLSLHVLFQPAVCLMIVRSVLTHQEQILSCQRIGIFHRTMFFTQHAYVWECEAYILSLLQVTKTRSSSKAMLRITPKLRGSPKTSSSLVKTYQLKLVHLCLVGHV